jgi:N-acetylneuraminic acid mutarotase
VHGGFDGTARDAGLFAFDFGTMMWREIIATQGRPPSARHSHSAVVYLNSLYIFGGYSGSYMSDLHEFDFTLSRWTPVPASGRRPRARYRATCCVHRNYLLLYGGHDGTRHLSDTFVFNFENQTWSALITEGILPTPRDSHISVMHDNSMFVFGGECRCVDRLLDFRTTYKWRAMEAR